VPYRAYNPDHRKTVRRSKASSSGRHETGGEFEHRMAEGRNVHAANLRRSTMKKLLAGIGLALLFFVSACTASRPSSPTSASAGENWATQRATQR
jgi:hypothetical protein